MMLVFLIAGLVATLAHAERFKFENDPQHFKKILGASLHTAFDELPLTGALSDPRLGWSESYWPAQLGGIAYRWNHPEPKPFQYQLHTKDEIKLLTARELGQLSPAELYDISRSDYGYTLTKKVLSLTSPEKKWWEGISDGWALAAMNYPEPGEVAVKNKEGVLVHFGASDVKALVAAHDSYNSYNQYARVGSRCWAPGKVPGEAGERDENNYPPSPEEAASEECRDLNAGAFHVVVANALGIHATSFIVDVDRFNDVWNKPVTGFSSEVKSVEVVLPEHRKKGIDRRLKIQTTLSFAEELQFFTADGFEQGLRNFVSKKPVLSTEAQAFGKRSYEYILELNAGGMIIGGEWISEGRPDFVWGKLRDRNFYNSVLPLAGLNKLYKPAKNAGENIPSSM